MPRNESGPCLAEGIEVPVRPGVWLMQRLGGRSSLGLALMLGALLPILLFAGLAIGQAMLAYRQVEERRLSDMAAALAVGIEGRLDAYAAALRTIAHAPTLGRLEEPGQDFSIFHQRVAAIAQELGGRLLVMGPGPDFPPLVNTALPSDIAPPRRPPEAQRVLEAALRGGAKGEARVTGLYEGPVSGAPSLMVVQPVIREGRVLGMLGFAFEPRLLAGLLPWSEREDGFFASIVDAEGRILTHTRGAAGPPPGALIPQWAREAMMGRDVGVRRGPNLRGGHAAFAFRRLDERSGWMAVVAQDAEARSNAASPIAGWITAGVAAFAVAVGILVWISRRQAVAAARAEAAALRAGRSEVQRLHDGLPAVIYLRRVAPDGTTSLLYRGGDLETVSGWPRATVAAMADWSPLYAPEGVPDRAFFLDVLREGTAMRETQLRQPDGGWRWLRVHARRLSLFPEGGGEVVGYLMDIDAERRAAARVVAAGRLSALGEMAAGLAHELKQPLQTIMLLSETADDAIRHGHAREASTRLERVIEQTDRAGQIIDNLRRFARGVPEDAALTAVPLEQAVGQTLALAAGPLREASVVVDLRLGPPPPVVQGHLISLEQALLNLVLNARDAMADLPPGRPRRLSITSCIDLGGEVRLDVADTGGGIAPAALERLFEPFNTTKSAEKGTGLGLSITRGLILSMGGTIEARNGPEGAVFSITLRSARG